jgi:hypothetical protein
VSEDEVYLGDGLHARYDGYYIVFTADKGSRIERSVSLEPGGWERLKELAASVGWEE